MRTILSLSLLSLLFLCTMSCDINGDPNGDKLLLAAANGNLSEMEEALSTGIDINYINPNFLSTQYTACSKAANNGQLAALKLLVEKGADWHKATDGKENPITLAANKKNWDIVFYLIELGEDVNYRETNNGRTALLSAAQHGNVNVIKKLMDLGADKTVIDKERFTTLMLAAKHCRPDALQFLINDGGNISGLLSIVAQFQGMGANLGPIKRTISVLVKNGADINEKNGDGDTPLHTASYYRNDEMIQILRSNGANPSITNNNNMTADDMYRYAEEQDNN